MKSNHDLESLAKKVITQTGIETLLYEHIQSSTIYAKRVDIRGEQVRTLTQYFNSRQVTLAT